MSIYISTCFVNLQIGAIVSSSGSMLLLLTLAGSMTLPPKSLTSTRKRCALSIRLKFMPGLTVFGVKGLAPNILIEVPAPVLEHTCNLNERWRFNDSRPETELRRLRFAAIPGEPM